jgi:galactokinase
MAMHTPIAPAAFTVTAPGRVNLIGEHTDYNDGFVLPMAIERHVTIRVVRRPDRLVVLRTDRDPAEHRIDLAGPLEPLPRHWSNYPLGVLAGYRRLGFDTPGFEATITSTLPAGAGLSSSAAIEVATATVVETLCGRSLEPVERALLCQRAEHDYARVPCGIMDQFAVCLGRAGHALQIDCRTREVVGHVPLDDGVRVLVVDSGVKHDLADGEYARRRDECAEAARRLGVASLRDVSGERLAAAATGLAPVTLARARHVVTENARVPAFVAALAACDWTGAGRLMAASHRSLSHDYEVSCRELDRLVEIATATPGVHGCRMTGGGFGGCVVALVDAGGAEATARAIHERYHRGTGIDAAWFLTAAADGPRMWTH